MGKACTNGAEFIHHDMADNSKPEFKASRSMYRMTKAMNSKYLASSKTPTTCGACHRGHMVPQPFTASGPVRPQLIGKTY